jgi:PleD family two-component response regulator
MNVLVIDDSAVDRYHLVSLLKSLGHDVDQCAEPGAVMELIAAKPYKMVFLDVVMPDFDGYRLLRSIRLAPMISDQYVVICSVKKTPLEINYGLERAGANDYLPKPATREGLEDVLRKRLAQCS